MSDQNIEFVRMWIEPGGALPNKIGQKLAPRGVKLMDFCKEFNSLTEKQKGSKLPMRVLVEVNKKTKAYKIKVQHPPTTQVIKHLLGQKGSGSAGRVDPVLVKAEILDNLIKDMYEQKKIEKRICSLESVAKEIEGTLKSMGFKVNK